MCNYKLCFIPLSSNAVVDDVGLCQYPFAIDSTKKTGFIYFGARYYDARLARWLSVDPPLITGEYLPTGNKKHDANLPGMGGIFNAVNLNAYHYAGLNPVKFVDPDGREIKSDELANTKVTPKTTFVNGIRVPIKPTDRPIVTSLFGYRVDPLTGQKGAYHPGVDAIPLKKNGEWITNRTARTGMDITVLAAGRVSSVETMNGYGNVVIVDHGKTPEGEMIQTLYAHNDDITVSIGEWVVTGDTIAKMGNTGRSTGQHTHFEIRIGGRAVNPEEYGDISQHVDIDSFIKLQYNSGEK